MWATSKCWQSNNWVQAKSVWVGDWNRSVTILTFKILQWTRYDIIMQCQRNLDTITLLSDVRSSACHAGQLFQWQLICNSFISYYLYRYRQKNSKANVVIIDKFNPRQRLAAAVCLCWDLCGYFFKLSPVSPPQACDRYEYVGQLLLGLGPGLSNIASLLCWCPPL